MSRRRRVSFAAAPVRAVPRELAALRACAADDVAFVHRDGFTAADVEGLLRSTGRCAGFDDVGFAAFVDAFAPLAGAAGSGAARPGAVGPGVAAGQLCRLLRAASELGVRSGDQLAWFAFAEGVVRVWCGDVDVTALVSGPLPECAVTGALVVASRTGCDELVDGFHRSCRWWTVLAGPLGMVVTGPLLELLADRDPEAFRAVLRSRRVPFVGSSVMSFGPWASSAMLELASMASSFVAWGSQVGRGCLLGAQFVDRFDVRLWKSLAEAAFTVLLRRTSSASGADAVVALLGSVADDPLLGRSRAALKASTLVPLCGAAFPVDVAAASPQVRAQLRSVLRDHSGELVRVFRPDSSDPLAGLDWVLVHGWMLWAGGDPLAAADLLTEALAVCPVALLDRPWPWWLALVLVEAFERGELDSPAYLLASVVSASVFSPSPPPTDLLERAAAALRLDWAELSARTRCCVADLAGAASFDELFSCRRAGVLDEWADRLSVQADALVDDLAAEVSAGSLPAAAAGADDVPWEVLCSHFEASVLVLALRRVVVELEGAVAQLVVPAAGGPLAAPAGLGVPALPGVCGDDPAGLPGLLPAPELCPAVDDPSGCPVVVDGPDLVALSALAESVLYGVPDRRAVVELAEVLGDAAGRFGAAALVDVDAVFAESLHVGGPARVVLGDADADVELLRVSLRLGRVEQARVCAVASFWRAVNSGENASDLFDVALELGVSDAEAAAMAAACGFGPAAEAVPSRAPVRVVFVGGHEAQIRQHAAVEAELERRFGDRVSVVWVSPGWSSQWTVDADRVEALLGSVDAMVLMRFTRTGLGERLRRCAGERGVPWVACTGHGRASLLGSIVRAVALVDEVSARR